MTKNNTTGKENPEETLENQQPVDERPNRSAFAARFSKRHPDVDFEDKEARYQALSDDDEEFTRQEESGRALSDMFDSNRWLAAMIMDLRDNPDLDPITWMAQNGVDIKAAFEDPEIAKKASEAIADFQEKKAKSDQHETELMENLRESAAAMDELGLSDEEKGDLWQKTWAMITDAEDGKISAETWKLMQNAYNYDADVTSAREEGTMLGRNEKIQNKVKSSNPEVPPTLPMGSGQTTQPKNKKKDGFFDGLTY